MIEKHHEEDSPEEERIPEVLDVKCGPENSSEGESDIDLDDVEELDEIDVSSLLEEGDKNYRVKNFEASADKYAQALEILVKIYGDLSDNCAEVYFKYGQSLFMSAENEEHNRLLGKNALKQVNQGK
jgi:hypothetical protein